MKVFVVDTNVIVVANNRHKNVSVQCVSCCANALQEIKNGGRIVLDSDWKILNEYQSNCNTNTNKAKGPGDVFLKWVLQNHTNPKRCDKISLKNHAKRKFKSFPVHDGLKNFDEDDRKFVAVSAAHSKKPKILQAVDSKWIGWEEALKECGVTVKFLCPDDIKRFHKKKTGL